jgi:hypothetical protein
MKLTDVLTHHLLGFPLFERHVSRAWAVYRPSSFSFSWPSGVALGRDSGMAGFGTAGSYLVETRGNPHVGMRRKCSGQMGATLEAAIDSVATAEGVFLRCSFHRL